MAVRRLPRVDGFMPLLAWSATNAATAVGRAGIGQRPKEAHRVEKMRKSEAYACRVEGAELAAAKSAALSSAATSVVGNSIGRLMIARGRMRNGDRVSGVLHYAI
jgi:hypothetical protein